MRSHRRCRLIGNADGVRATLASVFEYQVDVFAFARLGDANYEGMLQFEFCFVESVDRRGGKRYRNACRDLQKVTTEEGGVIRAAARHQYD